MEKVHNLAELSISELALYGALLDCKRELTSSSKETILLTIYRKYTQLDQKRDKIKYLLLKMFFEKKEIASVDLFNTLEKREYVTNRHILTREQERLIRKQNPDLVDRIEEFSKRRVHRRVKKYESYEQILLNDRIDLTGYACTKCTNHDPQLIMVKNRKTYPRMIRKIVQQIYY